MELDKHRVKHQLSRVGGERVYHLCGYHDWGADEITLAAEVTKQSGLFKGLALDIEPQDYKGAVVYIEDYAEGIVAACASTDYPIIVVVPYWLDAAIMERLVRASDGIILMDYCVLKDDKAPFLDGWCQVHNTVEEKGF